MRRYPEEIKEAKERYALSSPDAVGLVLYKHTPGHQDRYYYRTGLYDDGGMNYIDLNTGRKYVDVDSMPAEYLYDEVFTIDGRTYFLVLKGRDYI